MYSKILVPLDGSKRAEKILPYVEALARQLESTLLILRVVEPIYDLAGPHGTAMYVPQDLMEERKEEADLYVHELAEKYQELGLEVKLVVQSGPVVNTIIRVAEREDIDLIAMASHGRTGLARAFYGSVAAGVLHRVDRPLLLIRADGEG
jgi:nucleotide-binding universal stress UspA family protein